MIRVRTLDGLGDGDFFSRLKDCADGDQDACDLDIPPDVATVISTGSPGTPFDERLRRCASGDQSQCNVVISQSFASGALLAIQGSTPGIPPTSGTPAIFVPPTPVVKKASAGKIALIATALFLAWRVVR